MPQIAQGIAMSIDKSEFFATNSIGTFWTAGKFLLSLGNTFDVNVANFLYLFVKRLNEYEMLYWENNAYMY